MDKLPSALPLLSCLLVGASLVSPAVADGAGGGGRDRPKWIGFGADHPGRCLRLLDHAVRHPFRLRGRLAVTYVESSIDEAEGDPHELGLLDLGVRDPAIVRRTVNLINEAETDISPDGRRVVFTRRPVLDEFRKGSELWLSDIYGNGMRRIAHGGPMGVPAWFPDNRRVIYIRWGGESGDSRLMVVDTGTGRSEAFAPQVRGAADPEVSYDGQWVCFKQVTDEDGNGQPSIHILPADGEGRPRRLTRGYSDHDPVFSRDGRTIYFERYYGPGDWFEASQNRHDDPRNNWWGIVGVDVESGRERVLVPHDPCGNHFFWMPTVSPDGEHVMFTHIDVWGEERGRPWTDLWVVDREGRHPQKVPGSDWAYFFDWGPPPPGAGR